MLSKVAALYVDGSGIYSRMPGVEVWDEARDARKYAGPYPVVAHPPCARWCMLAATVERRYGYKRGDDGGCFAAALHAVRSFGGVLEHPAWSAAWRAHDLNAPPLGGAWVNADFMGGWTTYVSQAHYGHPAQKGTWLYARGVELPLLEWSAPPPATAVCSYFNIRADDNRPRLRTREASATPKAFAHVLLAMARSVRQERASA